MLNKVYSSVFKITDCNCNALYLSLLFGVRGWNSHKALGNKLILNNTLSTRLHLPHHLLSAGSALSPLLEFTHVFPVTLALLLLGVDTASIKRCSGGKCRPAERSGNECLRIRKKREQRVSLW